MPGFELLAAFFVATLLFAYVPGPSMMYAAAQTLAGGGRTGLLACLGIHVGGYAHVAAAAFGLSVLFHAVPILYGVIKFAGAAYLAFLGARWIWASLRPEPPIGPVAVAGRTPHRGLRDRVAGETLNPKTALFFLAFLPQFTDPTAAWPIWAQLLVLGTMVNWIFSSADLAFIALAGTLRDRVTRSERTRRLAKRAAGGMLIGLGVHLATQRT